MTITKEAIAAAHAEINKSWRNETWEWDAPKHVAERALNAALPFLPIAVEGKVKQLEWIEDWGGSLDDIPEWRAKTPFGAVCASVAGYRDQHGNSYEKHGDVPADLKAKLISEREAAYQTRILSALVSSPGKDGGQEVEAVKRWLVEETLPNGSVIWEAVEHEHHARTIASRNPGNITVTPLYTRPQPASTALVEWKAVPEEMTNELLAAATKGRQVLAYEKGRYYNAWLEFEQYEGGWLWFDEADSEPNPSHYCELPPEPTALAAAQSTIREDGSRG